MKTQWITDTIGYDGSQLSSHWILRTTGIVGDALVAFRGPCSVLPSQMADLEDLLQNATIAGADMLHFLWESFEGGDLLLAVHQQRLLSAQALEVLRDMAPSAGPWRRDGDDIYVGEGKLSISIATCSAVSRLIHFAVNCTNEGTPVATASLADLQVDPRAFADRLMDRAAAEQASIRNARAQVRAKGEPS